jgi:hypothetical protein
LHEGFMPQTWAARKNFARLSVLASLLWFVAAISAQEEPVPGIKRLDDATRARALAALAGLIILGFGLVMLTWLAARVVQRYRRGTSYFRPTRRPGEHDWAKKPLLPPEPSPPGSTPDS